jgi:hypothetical protein
MNSSLRALRSALIAGVARLAPLAYRQRWLARRLTHDCRERLALRQASVAVTARRGDPTGRHRVAIRRSDDRIEIGCDGWMLLHHPNEILHRLYGVLTMVAAVAPPRLQLVADISDGEESGPGLVSFCSRDPGSVLIPDHGFVRTRGYADHRRVAGANAGTWMARNDRIVWRGSTTGPGIIAKDELSADDPELRLRVRLCLALRDVPGTDAKLSGLFEPADKTRLAGAGVLGAYVSPITWNGYKFAIDIDGHSNAWSNFITRLIMGCCVLKVASPLGYRQWYYGDIEPWTHFVPLKADLSDLRAQIAWCRANLDACERIAARGQQFAMALDYDAEIAAAARRIGEAHANGRLRLNI